MIIPRHDLLLCLLVASLVAGASLDAPSTMAQVGADGTERVHSLLANGIQPGQFDHARGGVANDVRHLAAALRKETRPHFVTEQFTTVTPEDLFAAIPLVFGAADGDDVCIFYVGMHGYEVADANGDEPLKATDAGVAKDGTFFFEPGNPRTVLDDNMDTPFNALAAAGNCGHGMVLMFMACHSGELIVGANDFALGAPHVVMTSCAQPEGSQPCVVGGHAHSCYGGAGLVRGLTSGDGAAPARADGNGDGTVTAAELHAYAVANDADAGAVPQSSAAGSGVAVLTYAAPEAHGGGALKGAGGGFCGEADRPVGGRSLDPEAGALPLGTSGSSSSIAAILAGTVAGAVLGGGVAVAGGAWYARRRGRAADGRRRQDGAR